MRKAALRLSIAKSTLSDWRVLLDTGVPLLPDMKKKATYGGPLGQFALTEVNLLQFVFKLRGQGNMAVARKLVLGLHCDPHHIINMDQMPVYFWMNVKRTLEGEGAKMVHMCLLMSNTPPP